MDLGADEWTTFRKVTFPLIFPGILAAALLAFALSIDDFVITQFTAGQTTTFPLWVYGASRIGVPPQVNVMGTLIFLIALVGIVLWVALQRRDLSARPTRVSQSSKPMNRNHCQNRPMSAYSQPWCPNQKLCSRPSFCITASHCPAKEPTTMTSRQTHSTLTPSA